MYLGLRLLRLVRPLFGAAVIVGCVLALHVGHASVSGSAASAIRHGAAAARRDLPRAFERAFEPGPAQP